jgi:hypothetical protein
MPNLRLSSRASNTANHRNRFKIKEEIESRNITSLRSIPPDDGAAKHQVRAMIRETIVQNRNSDSASTIKGESGRVRPTAFPIRKEFFTNRMQSCDIGRESRRSKHSEKRMLSPIKVQENVSNF